MNQEIEKYDSPKSVNILREIIKWIHPNYDDSSINKLIDCFHQNGIDEPCASAYKDFKDEIELLLPILMKGKDNVKFADKDGRTILHICILHYFEKATSSLSEQQKVQDAKFIRTFMKMGASMIKTDNYGDTPLAILLAKDRIDLVPLILEICDVNTTDCNDLGQTILHILIDKFNCDSNNISRYIDMIKSLCNPHNLTKPDNNGVTPIFLAAKHFSKDMFQIFDNEVYHNLRTNQGDDLLIFVCKHITARKHNKDPVIFINWLLNKGCDVTYKNNAGCTALHYASQANSLLLIKTLIKAGADVHSVALDGTNIMYPVTMTARFEVLQELMKFGVATNCRDNIYGFTLMHMAALNHDERVLQWFIENGFDLNYSGRCGVTPLHVASMIGNDKAVQKLIDNGAKIHCRDKTQHCTVLHLASMKGEFLTIKDFISPNEQSVIDVNSSLITHCFNHLDFETHSDYGLVTITLLNAGADVHVKDVRGRTPLHYAVKHVDGHIAYVLLLGEACVDVHDNEGFTPLHCSLIHGHSLKHLIRYGADINDIEHPHVDILETIKIQKSQALWDLYNHLKKLKVARLPINNVYESWRGYKEVGPIYYDYMREVTRMKCYMLTSNVRLYDILHMDLKKQLKFVNKLPSDLEKEFPLYYPVIRGSFQRAINMPRMFESAKAAFQLITGSYWPDLCLDNIFLYLNDYKSLRVLIDTVAESFTDYEKLNVNF